MDQAGKPYGFLSTDVAPLLPGANDAERWQLVSSSLQQVAAGNKAEIERLFGSPLVLTPPGSRPLERWQEEVWQYSITERVEGGVQSAVACFHLNVCFRGGRFSRLAIQPAYNVTCDELGIDQSSLDSL
ncbi:MAG: hypothetical protein IPK73_25510 [Candidatus Obscuribacter sp.]|nr:hypothetical protein [Candidatus Obscuribacter sp.]MBK9277478.1 hypothetical protein [Candidatus Obscuribacter sp.]